MEDQDIITLFFNKGKESVAFEMLVDKYQMRMYWHIRKMVINHNDTYDVTQDTFIKIWKGLPNFKKKLPIKK